MEVYWRALIEKIERRRTMGGKQYGPVEQYEAKLEKVMQRLGVERYEYDWSRSGCWVSFSYKGQPYRFEHSVENAKEHGVNIKYGSDAFAQLVLALEDLARMVERGIYDLSTWVAGMKCLPAASAPLEICFAAMGFAEMPASTDEVKDQYRKMAKVMHPDYGGNAEAFRNLTENYNKCLSIIEGGTNDA
jgi:hypothetical protein